MKQYIYCVPTNRKLNENFEAFCDEVMHALQTYHCNVSFVVTDDTKENDNFVYVKKLAEKYNKIDFYYFDKESMSNLLIAVFQYLPHEEQETLKCLLPNEEINYGNTLNREFILSILLNCAYMIRRDSDVHIQTIEGKKLYPIDLEIQYLGENRNYIIGSGYLGKWGIDIDDMVQGNDYSLFEDMMCCLNIPRDFVSVIVEDEFVKTEKYMGDHVDFQSSAYPQCGNIGFYKLFYAFPCSPAADIIATDYFLQEACYELSLNVGFHTRTVLHKHTDERKDNKEKILEYWKRVAMWIDMELVYKSFLKKIEPYNIEVMGKEQMEKLNRYVLQYLKNATIENKELDELRHEKYKEFVDILQKIKKPIYEDIAAYLVKEEQNVHRIVTKAKYSHEALLEVWPHFVQVMEEVREHEEIKSLLEGAVIS